MEKISIDGNGEDNVGVGVRNSTARQPPAKRLQTGSSLATPSTTVTTSAASVSTVAVQENGFTGEMLVGEDSEDMDVLYEESKQSEREEEPGLEGSEEEGSYDVEDGEHQTDQDDEGSDEAVDDMIQGQALSGGDIVSNDVSYANTAESMGTKSSMFGNFTDQDVLDCPICYEALTIPVFQCENGHHACSSCCLKTGFTCPSCSWQIGYIRCRPIERIITSVKFSCRNVEYGCKETLLYINIEEHEKACIFAPCSCPLESCDYVGSPKNLYAHFRGKHLSYASQFNFKRPVKFWLESKHETVILQEKTDGTIFILNHTDAHFPHAINLIHIGALHSKEEFSYELSVDHLCGTLTLKSVTATMTKWLASQPLAKYLLVPGDFTYHGSISVEVCIEKRQEVIEL